MQWPELVESKPNVMMGKPCLKGTRIPVYMILQKMAAGDTQQELLADYPQLSPEHLRAALQYAAMIATDEVFPA